VLPSDDIRRAAAEFDGPTLAYATDTCASGGYWIASGCDELWARDASLVGSIGVVGSRPNAAGLADKLGISYEQFTAGEYKDAGVPLREIEDDDASVSTCRGSSTATTSSSSRRSARAGTWTRRRSERRKRGSTSQQRRR